MCVRSVCLCRLVGDVRAVFELLFISCRCVFYSTRNHITNSCQRAHHASDQKKMRGSALNWADRAGILKACTFNSYDNSGGVGYML